MRGRRINGVGPALRGNDRSTGPNASARRSPRRKDITHTVQTDSSAGSTSNPILFRARRWLSTSSLAQSQELLHWCANLLRNNDRAIKCNNGTIRLLRRADRGDIWWSNFDISLHRLTHTDRVLHNHHPWAPLLPPSYPLRLGAIPFKQAGFHLRIFRQRFPDDLLPVRYPPPPLEILRDRFLVDLVKRVRMIVRKEIRG
jgi:hypothetical protein